MIKKTTLLFVAFLMTFHVFADGITKNEAQVVARAFLHSRLADNAQITPGDLAILPVRVMGDDFPLFYVVNFEKGGFVLVSATDAAIPVLGYSPIGEYSSESQSPAMIDWIKGYELQLNEIIEQQLLPTSEITEAWNDLLFYNPAQTLNNRDLPEVEPLLPSLWNQGSPYNKLCPEDPAGPGGRVYAGCVATAMSQVIYYWRYPLQGIGSHGYYSDYGYLFANYGETEYKYEEMTNSISSSDYFEMAQIQYHCGIAVDMMYSASGSGAYSDHAVGALRDHFGFSNSISMKYKYDYTNTGWADLLIQNLDNGWPLYYSGHGSGGHAFNMDGYKGTDYFHFNWGWSGTNNGYYYLNNLNPGGNNFNDYQGVIVNCFPAGNYPYYCDGVKTLTNKNGTIEDGSGPVDNYITGLNCGWLIAPPDSVTGLTLNFEKFDLAEGIDVLNIFDGPDASYPLLASLSGDTVPSPVTAAGDRMFIEFLTSGDQGKGFRLSYRSSNVVYCEGTTVLTDPEGVINDGSGARNYNHNSMCKFKIVPEGAQSITINFNYLDTEPDHDVIMIYNLANQKLVATFSGNEIPEAVTVPSGKALLLFSSDDAISSYGWEVEYTSSTMVSVPFESLHQGLRVQAYPVPATDWLRVKLESTLSTDVSLCICDISGRVLMSDKRVKLNGQHTEMLGIDNLAAGIYFLKYTSEAGSGSLKIVISK